MRVLKKLLLAILLIVLAMGLGGAIYIVQTRYFTEPEVTPTTTPEATSTAAAAPTEEPDLTQYVITIDTVNIRQEPTTDSAIIEQVGKDTVLQLLYSDAEWSSIVYEGQNAYVNNEYVKAHNVNSAGEQKGAGKIIAIDAGCQSMTIIDTEPIGPDGSVTVFKATSGYIGMESGKKEYEINLEIALKLKSALEKQGYQVVMTRETNDANISNVERAELVNASSANICISIRSNASFDANDKGVVGVCPSINNPYNPGIYNNSYKLANALSNEVAMAAGTWNAGVWQTDILPIINWSDVPITVLQVGYLTNAEEEQNLINEDYQNKIVDGILNGLDAYFGQ